MIVVGYSGHSYCVIEASKLSSFNIVGYSDVQKSILNPFNLKYYGHEMNDNFLGFSGEYSFILGIGDNRLRNKIGNVILSKGFEITNVIHPISSMSRFNKMGYGNFIARNASINPMVELGNFCIVNTGAILEHGCRLGDSVHIAPGAVVAGNVEIGDLTFVGANSVIREGIKIGNNVTIGAGAVVLENVPTNSKMVGNPAIKIN